MAKMLPPNAYGPKSLRALYQAFKALPDQFTIWQRLPHHPAEHPDFCLLHEDGRALLLKLSPATEKEAQAARQPSLLDTLLGRSSQHAPLGQAEQTALDSFCQRLALPTPLPTALLFPALDRQSLRQSRLAPGTTAASQEELGPGFEAWVMAQLGTPLAADAQQRLQAAVAPEKVVPAALTARAPIDRRAGAQLTDFLLDYDQEWALKLDLALSDEAQPQVSALQLRLINGVAGSGKSLIVLYRAKLLRDLFPHYQILVTTHNKALICELEARYGRLGGNGTGTTWTTFQAWCLRLLSKHGQGSRVQTPLLKTLHQQFFEGTSISAEQLREELAWYKDQLLWTRADYLAANRRGRGFALQASMRERMYDAFEAYQQQLGGCIDWGDVPRLTYQLLQAKPAARPQYDVVLVDEAQFFAPIWFELIKMVLKPGGHLFMVADPSQGFLGRGRSWLASGLDVRGRSIRLPRSYRTTRAILDFARRFYRSRLPEDEDEIVEPELAHMPPGSPPELVSLTSEQDQLTRLVAELQRFQQGGGALGHVLIIHPTKYGMEAAIKRLQATFGPQAAGDPRQSLEPHAIRVCTLDAVTGLEAPLVIVLGLHHLFAKEAALGLSDEERATVIRDTTRRLYMAITRAGQRVALFHVGPLPPALQTISTAS